MSELKVVPMGNKLIVLPDADRDTTSGGGIIISSVIRSQLQEGTVIKVSSEVAELVSPGDRILFPRNAGVEREYNGVTYKFINGPTLKEQGDIWAIL